MFFLVIKIHFIGLARFLLISQEMKEDLVRTLTKELLDLLRSVRSGTDKCECLIIRIESETKGFKQSSVTIKENIQFVHVEILSGPSTVFPQFPTSFRKISHLTFGINKNIPLKNRT